MSEPQSEVIEALDDILQFLYDSKLCFDKHVENVQDDDLKKLFTEISWSRQNMIEQIQQILKSHGVSSSLKGTFLGKTHMIFENIKAYVTQGNPLAITKEVRRGESVLIDYYKKAAALPLDENLKIMLLKHISKIEDDVKKSDLFSVS